MPCVAAIEGGTDATSIGSEANGSEAAKKSDECRGKVDGAVKVRAVTWGMLT